MQANNMLQKTDYINNLTKGDNNNLRYLYETARDVRKFEIELYWKRAAYFWAFVSVLFIGYYQTIPVEAGKNIIPEKFLINCLILLGGYIFSLGWFFVNKGSKFWQENWEAHITMLENELNEPLFGIIKRNTNSCIKLTKSYPYSVSKINQILSLIVVLFWGILILSTSFRLYSKMGLSSIIIAVLLIISIPIAFHFGAKGFAANVPYDKDPFFYNSHKI